MLFCFFALHIKKKTKQKKNPLNSFICLRRIYGTQICLRFYLTFNIIVSLEFKTRSWPPPRWLNLVCQKWPHFPFDVVELKKLPSIHNAWAQKPYKKHLWRAPHTQTYSFLPCYQTYNSKVISKKFPKKLRASLSDLQLRKETFIDSWKFPLAVTQTYKETFLDSRKFSLPVVTIII